MEPIGIYIHIPFCGQKCPYCDFFSVCSLKSADEFTAAVLRDMERYRDENITADSLYLGGGTPTELGEERLVQIINRAKEIFSVSPSAEITVETNPKHRSEQETLSLLCALKNAGVNRLSVGMQSAADGELEQLGRAHKRADVIHTVKAARVAKIDNISLDIMLGIPRQTEESLRETVGFAQSLSVTHISAYILKIEPKTVFDRLFSAGRLSIPDEDQTARLYLKAAELLEQSGFKQYEISNFSRPGFEGRHNLKYWHDEQYLGFGPSAHSFYKGKRFFYPRSITKYSDGLPPVPDGEGGDLEEYLMLGLRLCEGVEFEKIRQRFSGDLPEKTLRTAKELARHGLMTVSDRGMALTRQGFLLSNEIISRLI